MKKIEKELVLNIYSKLSLVIGLSIFIILAVYFSNLPELMYGVVEKGIFNLNFRVAYDTYLDVFNWPLILFIVFFLFNLGVLIYAQKGEKVEGSIINGSIFYNTVLSFLLIVAHLVFYFIVPDTINGAIEVGLFQYEFKVLSDVSNTGINFGYILATIYTLYNIFVIYSLSKDSNN